MTRILSLRTSTSEFLVVNKTFLKTFQCFLWLNWFQTILCFKGSKGQFFLFTIPAALGHESSFQLQFWQKKKKKIDVQKEEGETVVNAEAEARLDKQL